MVCAMNENISKDKSYWNAVVTGAFVSTGLSLLLFSLSFGMFLDSNKSESTRLLIPISSEALNSTYLLPWIIVIFFVSGYTTGKLLAPIYKRFFYSILCGFLTWVLSLIIGYSIISGKDVLPLGSQSSLGPYMEYRPESQTHKKIEEANKTNSYEDKIENSIQSRNNDKPKHSIAYFLLFSSLSCAFGGLAGVYTKNCREIQDRKKD